MTDTTTPVTSGFDLMALLNDDPTPVTFKVPTMFNADGEPIAGLIIVGKNSSEYQSTEKKLRIDNVMRSANRKTAIDSSTESGAETLIQRVDINQRMTALAVTVGWYGFTINGADSIFDPDTLPKIFDKFPTWQTKVLLALEADANFLKV